jgi:hypothetical protein
MLIVHVFDHQQIRKQQWDEFVAASPQGCLYARSWYLDIVMPGWGAIVVMNGSKWQGVMPIRLRKKFGLCHALQPTFSQYLGVLFTPIVGRDNHVLHKKKEILKILITAIPTKIRFFSYNFNPTFDYFLPFLRNGFDIKPRTTLTLSLFKSIEELTLGFSTSVLNHTKKAEQNGLICRQGEHILLLTERMLRYGFINSKQDEQVLIKLWQEAKTYNRGFLLEVVDSTGMVLCSGLFLVDKQKAVFVASALDRKLKHLGSNALMVVEAIKICQKMRLTELDFKGSMLPGVEQFFLGFNPQQIVYYEISRKRLYFWEIWAFRFLQRKKSVRHR